MKPYYSKNDFALYLGNCLKILPELSENSVDMVFADPPHFLSSGSFTCQNGKMVSVKRGDRDLSNDTRKNFGFNLG